MTMELEEILLTKDNEAMSHKSKHMKFVIVGESGVGKTAFTKRLVHHTFSSFYTQSIGVNFHTSNFTVNGTYCIVQHLDIAGFERFSGMTQQYYQGAVGALVMFDLTNEKSLESATVWKNDIDSKCCTATKDKIPCLLIGTKFDLSEKQENQRTDEELEQYSIDKDFIGLMKVSSQDGTAVTQAFEKLISFVLEKDIAPYYVEGEGETEEKRSKKSFFCC